MKTLTMVTKYGLGTKNESVNDLDFILIAEDYSFVKLNSQELIKDISSKKYYVTNVGVNNGQLIGINGVLDRYTIVNEVNGQVMGKPAPVVLDRVETEKGLVGYTIFNAQGALQEVTVEQAIKIQTVTPFANGKLKHTQTGAIISSISGNYPLRVIEIKKKAQGKLSVAVTFFGETLKEEKEAIKYAGIMVESDNAAVIGKVSAKLISLNEKLIADIYGITRDETVKDSLKIQRTLGSGFYGVFPVNILRDLLKLADNSIKLGGKNIIISSLDYSEEGKVESLITLNKEKGIENEKFKTQLGERESKEYAMEIVKLLNGVKIK